MFILHRVGGFGKLSPQERRLAMISKFHVRNYRSIVDYTLDLSYAEGKAPAHFETMSSYPFLQPKGNPKLRLVPCLALFGANASGKSNILRAFYALADIVENRNAVVNHDPNRLHPSQKATFFSIEFVLGEDEYSYQIEYKATGILSESLSVNGKVLFRIRNLEGTFPGLKTEAYPEAKLQEILRVECSGGKPKYDEARLTVNEGSEKNATQMSSFLSVMGSNYAGLNAEVAQAHQFFTQDLLLIPNEMRTDLLWTNLAELAFIKDYTVDSALDDVAKLLTKFDLGIKKLSFQPDSSSSDSGSSDPDVRITAAHVDEFGGKVVFEFDQESDGTRVLSGIVCKVLLALELGGVLVVDELDKSLHPVLQRELIRLFKDKERNPKQAQLIFTAHNTDILDGNRLRMSEVGIVSKTQKKGTTCKRLVEFDGIRNVTNFRKQYLDGAFDGIPFPYL